jgi:hypothetical protein
MGKEADDGRVGFELNRVSFLDGKMPDEPEPGFESI